MERVRFETVKTHQKILVAMSGGLDSSVAAAVLVQQGYEVIGLTMQIWQESQRDPRHAGCCSLGAVEDARRVAAKLNIPHYVVNMKEEFKANVIDHFVDAYANGQTPNPCVECNRHVKFELLFEKMESFGCSQLATGHYARIQKDSDGLFHLYRPKAKEKDQSYVLYMLDQVKLSRTLFPMGEFESKADARRLAHELDLCVADKPESQDICFVSEAGGYKEFLRKVRPELFKPGRIVTESGETIGEHESISGFTIGQRKGIRVAAKEPLFVLQIHPESNTVTVGSQQSLQKTDVRLNTVHYPAGVLSSEGIEVFARIRYNMEPKPAVFFGGSEPKLSFHEPVRAVTPGQIAVAYRDGEVVAGGIITG